MKVSEILAKANLQPVTKGRNLELCGWADGYLVVKFHGSPTLYINGPNVAEVERDKLLRSIYPDSLFNKLKAKHNWQCLKVG